MTAFLGSLVAGNDAGKIYTNWPFMGSNYFIPDKAFDLTPLSRNLVENPAMV